MINRADVKPDNEMCAEAIATDRVETQPTFDDLRRLAQHARMRPLIEQRKDRIAPSPWKFEPDSKYHRDHDTLMMCNRLTDMFAEPDGITPFQGWMRMILEDAFCVGGTAIFLHRGTEKVFFRLMDFAGIGLIRDQHGNAPLVGAPFAAQMIGEEPFLLGEKELLYAVRHPIAGRVYGGTKLEMVAALEHAESGNVLKESKDGAMFRVFEPLIGPVDEDREWIAEQVIDKLVARVFGETHCKFRWKVL